jgi:hypothetical protein
MSKELALLLGLQFDEYFEEYQNEVDDDGEPIAPLGFNCDLITGDNVTDENVNLIKLLKIHKYSKDSIYNIVGNAYYQTNSAEDSFSFIYELKSGRIIDIELKEITATE